MCKTCGCEDKNFAVGNHEHHHEEILSEEKVLDFNDKLAEENAKFFRQKNILCFNFLSSPGSGKTTLLEATLRELGNYFKFGLVEGDQQTDFDAQRLKKFTGNVVQINTNKGCHLDAHQVQHALDNLDLENLDFLLVENVGNLVCPSMFELGEQKKIVILSVTEGDDKPLKYPNAFFESELAIISKTDLLPYVDFNVYKCIEFIKRINPKMEIILLSTKSMEGFDDWKDWLIEQKQNFTNKF
ncbi:hydrogenase nickel incorporation protein HypB [bacterium]|nr:hydrogenase nickel incorporation protein HypB [bacterium]